MSILLIKFTGNNPKGKGSLVVNRQAKVKNPIIQTEFKAEVSKIPNPTGSGQETGKRSKTQADRVLNMNMNT